MNDLWTLDHVSLGQRLRDVTLRIAGGVTAVLGPSGAGKTSLLNLLVAFEQADAGSVTAHVGLEAHTRPLFWAPQGDGLWPHLTVREHLQAVAGEGRARPPDAPSCVAARVPRAAAADTAAATTGGGSGGPALPDADALLAEFDLTPRAHARPETLSQGERARLAVARALAADARVLVMDEPLAHVDPARVGKYWDVLSRRMEQAGTALVFATHVPGTVLAQAQQVICLRDGRVVYAGGVEELYASPPTAELAECLGEANWMEPADARLWLQREEAAARCLRPERIVVVPVADSPLVVESARFHGAVAEVVLRHEASSATRRFWHRPAGSGLAKGMRVRVAETLS